MMKLKFQLIVSVAILAVLAMSRTVSADTVQKKDGSEIKGVVLDDYKDRIILSTADGELHIMKTDIKKIYFDSEERSLLKIAEQARDRGDYVASYNYYEKALAVNPHSKDAQAGIAYLQSYVYKQEEMQKERFVNDHNEHEARLPSGPIMARNEKDVPASAAALRKVLGVVLKSEDNLIKVESIDKNSPASDNGMEPGDILVAVWGRLVRFMPLDEATRILLKNHRATTQCIIERTIEVAKADKGMLANTVGMLGAGFEIMPDGLTATKVVPGGPSDHAGLKQNDLLAAINERPTRYLPLGKALRLIKDSKDSVKLTIQRTLVLVRR